MEIKIINKDIYKGDLKVTDEAAGIDLRYSGERILILKPNEDKIVGSGLAVNLSGTKSIGVLCPKSGMGSKGLVLGNLIGIIDADYQGEIKVNLWNRSGKVMTVQPGQAIAQLVIIPVAELTISKVDEFSAKTERGEKGFGEMTAIKEKYSVSKNTTIPDKKEKKK